MIKLLSKLTATPKGRYLIVGGTVYGLELVIIAIAQRLGASAVGAVAISFWVGLVLSFILQKIVTFQDKRSAHKIVLAQIVAVALLVLWNFGFTILVTKLLSSVPPAITRTIALLITTIWNYYLYRTRIFTGGNH